MKKKLLATNICAGIFMVFMLSGLRGCEQTPEHAKKETTQETTKVTIENQLPAHLPEQTTTKSIKKTEVNVKSPDGTLEKKTHTEITQKEVTAPITRTIKVENTISEKDKKYKYLMIHYGPSEFSLSANGTLVDNTADITITDNNIDLTYYAKFQNGRETSKKYTYRLTPATKSIEVSFDWHKDPRVYIDAADAELVSDTVVK